MDKFLVRDIISIEDKFLLSQLMATLPNVVKEHEEYWNLKVLGEFSNSSSKVIKNTMKAV